MIYLYNVLPDLLKIILGRIDLFYIIFQNFMKNFMNSQTYRGIKE